jgi:hypothetical protein
MVCPNAKDRNGDNMDVDIGILRDRPTGGNYGALTKRVAEGSEKTDSGPVQTWPKGGKQLEVIPDAQGVTSE